MLSKSYKLFSKSAIPALFKQYQLALQPDAFIAAAHVFPMRINNHVADDLIDWQVSPPKTTSFQPAKRHTCAQAIADKTRSKAPSDPMFKLSVPQPDMLHPDYLGIILAEMTRPGATKMGMQAIVEVVRQRMNPHPAGQKEENVPQLNGVPLPGLQHKYRETVLFFPSEVCTKLLINATFSHLMA